MYFWSYEKENEEVNCRTEKEEEEEVKNRVGEKEEEKGNEE